MSNLIIALGEPKKKNSSKITDWIKTFEDACREMGIELDSKIAIEAPAELADDLKSIGAYAKLTIIARALNEGWKPDWTDSNQYKWHPFFEANKKAGFGFSRTRYGYWLTHTSVGSRLCFKSEALAKYAGEQFIDIYNDFLTL
jgi:hypothetical protein